MTQSMISGKQPRRAISIIPAIPRKLEKKTDLATNCETITQIDVEKAEQSAKDASEPDNHVTNDANRRFASPENKKDGVLGRLNGVSIVAQEPAGGSMVQLLRSQLLQADHTLAPNKMPLANTQDFGIERHGFKLPPPFYPSHPSPEPSSTKSSVSTDPSNSQRPSPDTIVVKEGDTVVEQAIADPSSQLPLGITSSSFHSHPTPPDDEGPSPTQSSYQGYSHVQYMPFYPQPTPPTEASLSPIRSSYQRNGHAHSISFHPPASSSLNDNPSPTQSSYEGYSYGHAFPAPQALYQSYSDPQQQPCTSLRFRDEFGSGLPYYSQAPAFSPLGSHPPLTPSATPLNSGIMEIPKNLSHHHDCINDSASTASTIPRNLESPYRTTSESTLGFEDALSFSTTSKSDKPAVSPERDLAFETWRTTVLKSLQHVPPGAIPDQPSLSVYLLQHFNSEDSYSDCYLQITHKSRRFQATDYQLHSLLLAQSPKLQALLNTAQVGPYGKRLVSLEVQDRYSTPPAINSALRVCYGESPYNFIGSAAYIDLSKPAADISISWMDSTLAFVAAGQLIQLHSVVARGLQIVSAILNWHNLERAISFALDRGLHRSWDLSFSAIPTLNHPIPFPAISGSGSSDSSIESSSVEAKLPCLIASSQSNGNGATTDATKGILYECLLFILSNCPHSWVLDESARPLADNDRLPNIAEGRSPMSKSRLSRIQFGDYPSENTAKSSDPNNVLSSILLSVPFALLKYLLDHLGEPIKRRNSKLIVAERERRRLKVLKSDSVSSTHKQAAADVRAEVEWEEFVTEEGFNLLLARK